MACIIETRPSERAADSEQNFRKVFNYEKIFTDSIRYNTKHLKKHEDFAHERPTLMITYVSSFHVDRKSFCRLIDLLTWNSDDEIIATRILPSIQFEPMSEMLYGTSLKNPTHYAMGVFKRILPDYPVDQDTYEDFAKHYKHNVHKLQPIPHIPFMSHEMLDKYWLVPGCKYSLKEIQHFHELLDQYEQGDCYKDIYANQSFIKRELYEEEKFARIINSRSDTFKVLTAPYTKMIEEEVYVKTFSENFIKHHEPEWITNRIKNIFDKFGMVCETDYSSFESSFGVKMMRLEKYFFDYMLQNNPEVRDIIDKAYTRENRLISNIGIMVSVMGTRMSGEMWTSLGNGFMNYNLVTYVARKSNAVADFIVEGDDCLVGFDKEVNYDFVTKLGFKLKLEYGTDINDLSFCGYKVRRDGKPLVDIERSFRGLAYTRKQEILDKKETRKFKFKEYITCLALSYYYRCQYTPFLNTLLYKIIKDCSVDLDKCRRYLDWWSFGQAMKNVNLENVCEPVYDDEFYHYVEYELGIPRELYIKINNEIQNISYDQDIIVNLHAVN